MENWHETKQEAPALLSTFTPLFFLLLLVSCGDRSTFEESATLPSIFSSQSDYTYMWWKKTIKTGNQIFAIKTNRYSLAFDYEHLAIQDFSIIKNPESAATVLTETNAGSFPSETPAGLRFGITHAGDTAWVKTTSGRDDDCQLVETGKYFQRRFITNLPDLAGCDPFNSGLEISSWPDRIAFLLKTTLDADKGNFGLTTQFTFPKAYSVLLENGNLKALKNPTDGSGYILHKSNEATNISISGTTVKVDLVKTGFSPKGLELNAGVIVYPVANRIDSKLEEIAGLENDPLRVEAKQIAPTASPLQVNYDHDKGWYQIALRSDNIESDKTPAEPGEGNPGPQSDLNNRMERVQFSVTNPTEKSRVVRLNFAKGRLVENGASVFGTPGISAVLRDITGNPIGIPIQLSKNWHTGGRSGYDNHYFQGTWYHGLTMLTIPADSTITLEYTSVNSLWGGVPAASHAQLCLVGWGHNQQWDESAIGAWGETLTYEPDLDQTGAPILDFRPLLVTSPEDKKWGWTGNIGGADVFNYTKTDGHKGWHSRIRTDYKRYSPNLTEVTYAGTLDDNSMDFQYTASIGRSDDLVRGIYKIRLDVLEETSFQDFVIFQVAAADYHHVKSKNLSWGNETGLMKKWTATVEGEPRYITPKEEAKGKVIWFSFNDSEYTSPQQLRFRLANRGFIIREWKTRINGMDHINPWFAEYKTAGGDYGDPSGIINITPPPSIHSFKKGDYIEAEIVLLAIPLSADDYYGPNKNFAQALKNKANTWEMVFREAVGNDIELSVSKGKKLDNYPIKIEAADNQAAFSITGGLGYVPLTLSKLENYQRPELFEKINGKWEKIDQSVHGHDFWQAEYDVTSGTWDITYNIDLDSKDDQPVTRFFKFNGQTEKD